jgi:hypothetical protein
MKWSVIAGCSAFLALACGGTAAETGTGGWGEGWRVPDGVLVPVGGGGPDWVGGSRPVPPGGVPIPVGGASPGGVGGSGPVPTYGGATAAGGGQPVPVGGAGPFAQAGASGIDPNSCSHDVARCLDAAAACFEYSPWSDCAEIVSVCSAMEAQCSAPTGGTAIGVVGTGGVGTGVAATGGASG